MSAARLPDFQKVADGLKSLDALSGAAETHGLLCALLCGGANITQSAWVDSLQSSFHDAKDTEFANIRDTLVALFDATEANINSPDCDVDLLLPADSAALHLRIQALAEWCQGFLSGLKLLGLANKKTLSPELQEALDHLIHISCLEYEPDDEADAESEASYVELFEFARMAVILLHSMKKEIFPKRPSSLAGNNTVH